MSNLGRIAVFVPQLGILSETFIRRYVNELTLGGNPTISRGWIPGGWAAHNNTALIVGRPTGISGLVERTQFKIRAHRKEQWLWSDRPHFRRLVSQFLKEHKIEVVFSQYLHAGLHLQRICSDVGVKHVVRGHGHDITQEPQTIWGRKYYHGLAQFDAVIVPTPFQTEKVVALGGIREKTHAVPYGVDIPQLFASDSNEDSLVECLSVGRFVPKKAPDLTLQAFLEATKQEPRLRLTMVGEGEMLARCQSIASQSPHSDRVIFLGSCSNEKVKDLMAESDIFLQHSVTPPESGDQEGAPVAIMEAMAYGLPVISTRHSGIPFQVDDNKTGLLVDEYDSPAMALAILELAQNTQKRKSMGKAGREKAIELFSWDREREAILQICAATVAS